MLLTEHKVVSMKEQERKKSTGLSPDLDSSDEDLKTYGSCYDLLDTPNTLFDNEVVFVSDSELDEVIKDLTGSCFIEEPGVNSG